jgi:hypothetical protein
MSRPHLNPRPQPATMALQLSLTRKQALMMSVYTICHALRLSGDHVIRVIGLRGVVAPSINPSCSGFQPTLHRS